MKNKQVYVVLLVVFSVICLWNIVNTVIRVSKDTWLNKQEPNEVAKYFNNEDNYKGYKSLVRHSLSLGLDLQGGMYVTLEIGVADVVKGLAGENAKDSAFTQAHTFAARTAGNNNFVDVFARKLEEIKPGAKLGAYFANNASSEEDKIRVNTPTDKVVAYLKREADKAIERSFDIIRTRIDQFGVASPNLQRVPGTNRILVELPGVKDANRVRRLLRGTANLEFWPTHTAQEMQPVMNQIAREVQTLIAAGGAVGKPVAVTSDSSKITNTVSDTTKKADDFFAAKKDTTKKDTSKDALAGTTDAYFPGLSRPKPEELAGSSPRVGFAKAGDTAQVNFWLSQPQVKRFLRDDIAFMWTYKPVEENNVKTNLFSLIAIKTNRTGQAPLSGDAVETTRADRDQNTNNNVVKMEMNAEGARKWRTITSENIGRSVAVVLDGYVYTYPTVNDVIATGSSQITGNFTQEEASDLANILKAGKLPAPARIEGEEIVGPTLGQEAVNSGLISFIVSFIAVLLFVQLYYGQAGTIANIALFANLFFLIGVCSAENVVMTLPGIAGIILSLAMAVDANVLIYERVREELEAGMPVKAAVEKGFSNALSSIIDSNITTFLTGLILYLFGTGPIKGFAVTLMAGIITTLITGLLVTRLLLDYYLNKSGKSLSFGNMAATRFFKNRKLNIIPNRSRYLAVALGMCAIFAVSFGVLSFKLGIDFNGGRQYVVKFQNNPDLNKVRSTLSAKFQEDVQVKTVGVSGKDVMITTSYLFDRQDVDEEVRAAVVEGLKTVHPEVTVANIAGETKVGPTIAQDIIRSAILSVIFSLIMMFLYIFLRFRRWEFGVGALGSLAVNVVVVLGVFSALSVAYAYLPFSVEINQTFIGALLTIVGYSVNDTVVVFDRIRERLNEVEGEIDYETEFNTAINETLSRTIVTAATTLISAFILMLLGGEVLRGFMFAMILGIVVGTFSSIAVASPITLGLMLRNLKKKNNAPMAPAVA
jgi:SecD/SecF fusion protein